MNKYNRDTITERGYCPMSNKKEEKPKMSLPVEKLEEYHKSGFPKKLTRTKFDLPINERLKEARTRRGYSLKKVVQLLKPHGIDTAISTIQGYEYEEATSYHRYPSVHMLLLLANIYDVSADYLLGISNEFSVQTNDVYEILEEKSTVSWKGNKMTEVQRKFLIEKAEQIMSL
jgi:transcriptional regulator with XRE-family HTH domain